jgi:hypothetical protein
MKGAEIRSSKNGVSDYSKIRKRFGKEYADHVVKLADNVLRYEVEFRPGMLTQLFISGLKQDNPTMYKTVKANRQIQESGFVTLSDGSKANFDGLDNEGVKRYEIFSPEVRRHMAIGKHVMSKEMDFKLIITEELSLKRLLPHDFEIKNGKIHGYNHVEKFDYALFCKCVDKFRQICQLFQLGHHDHLNKLQMAVENNRLQEMALQVRVRDYEASGRAPEQYDEKKVRMFIDLLKEMSWDEVKRKKIVSDTTFFKYKKLFTSVGIKERLVGYNTGVNFTYGNYYDLVFADWNRISQRTKY